MEKIGRIITAMVTPFKENGEVDYKKAEEMAVFLTENGSDGVVVHGTTGESPTLTHDEEYELYKVVKNALQGKASLIAGTGSNSTDTTIRSTKKAEQIGADAALLVVPYYNKPSQEGLYQHYRAVARSTGLPLIIYNIPGRTGINMLPETVARTAEFKNIIGLKDAAGDLNYTSAARTLLPKDFLIWSGDDSLTLPMMSVGAYGVISVASHLAGREIKKMVDLYVSGDVNKAEEIHRKLMPLFKVLFIAPNPSPLKFALKAIGHDCGKTRLPLVEPSAAEKKEIIKVMKGLSLIEDGAYDV
ncbi:MAG: 4-hydroxy-tetrahydrodipicolinate synthase [Candidatus Saganbacteria bacterium]|nr:4-hydroxy-tetrahydrodipicolinate synthase [Candidatus Saganbacteria bacterium]